jgi:hypothetical protein
MKVVMYFDGPAEERMATGLIGPLRRWISPLANAVWQGRDAPLIDVQARSSEFDTDNPEYLQALERAVFGGTR